MYHSNHLFFENNDNIAFSLKKDHSLVHYYNEKKLFQSASLIKLPIMLFLFTHHYNDFNQMLKLDTRIEGAGVTPYLSLDQYSVNDLMTLMIILSDNCATNTLIDWLGMDNINQFIQSIGMKDTILQRKMMDFEALKKGKDNITSMRDMQRLLDIIVQHPHFEAMFTIMKQQLCKDKTLMYEAQFNQSDTIEIGTKTGDLHKTYHEVGLIRANNRIYSFVILTTNQDATYIHPHFHSFGLMLPQLMR